VTSKATRGTINFVIPILAYWVPLILTLLCVWAAGIHVAASQRYVGDGIVWWSYGPYPLPINGDHLWMSGFITGTLLLTIMYICTKIAGHLARKESALQMREKFI